MHRARLPIAQPCHERFDAMTGDGAERFCDRCSTPVHDLSQMTKVEAQHFLAQRSGRRVCVRYRSDAAGELQFRPAPPARSALALAVASLVLAACTGYVDADEIESPEDAIACEDASGYTIPCEDTTAPPLTDTIGAPDGGDVGVGVDTPDVEMGQVQTVEMGDVEVLTPEPEPDFMGEMVVDPVPHPGMDDSEALMGKIAVPHTSSSHAKRLERQWKREQRRQARRDRR